MKNVIVTILLLIFFGFLKAGDPYHAYLLTRINKPFQPTTISFGQKQITNDLSIPRYKIPAGNVFCRMEDKLTKATKVWITVGVK